MTNEEIIIIYKKIGQDAEFKKIQKQKKIFEDLIGGELDYISYEDITIIARRNREHLKPNIYINTEFLSIGSSIRGDIIIASKENKTFKSLTKKQAIKYREFLKRASFNYDNFGKRGQYILNNSTLKNHGQPIIEKGFNEDDKFSAKDNETLKLILAMQSIILKYIKDNSN